MIFILCIHAAALVRDMYSVSLGLITHKIFV